MKTIIKYILAAPLMLCFSSCLDEHPKDQLTRRQSTTMLIIYTKTQ